MLIRRLLPSVSILLLILSSCSFEGITPKTLVDENASNTLGQPQQGVITAAEWNDQDNWSFWKDLHQRNKDLSQTIALWDIDAIRRYHIRLVDKDRMPIANAKVSLISVSGSPIWEGRTDNQGTAELWASLIEDQEDPVSVHVKYQGVSKFVLLEDTALPIELDISAVPQNAVQVMFVIDATGSMGDELDYLKVELANVIKRVNQDLTNSDLEMGAVVYRDQGDEYITRKSSLTNNTSTTVDFLSKQYADGGGDYPEAVEIALAEALADGKWKEEAQARLIFLLLDAPPHHNTGVVNTLHNQVKDAAKRGIKIVPISGSGINKETEFLMRLMALSSNGSYVFVTDDSGVGDSHLEPTVGQYQVEYLNDLLVRLITQNAN